MRKSSVESRSAAELEAEVKVRTDLSPVKRPTKTRCVVLGFDADAARRIWDARRFEAADRRAAKAKAAFRKWKR